MRIVYQGCKDDYCDFFSENPLPRITVLLCLPNQYKKKIISKYPLKFYMSKYFLNRWNARTRTF